MKSFLNKIKIKISEYGFWNASKLFFISIKDRLLIYFKHAIYRRKNPIQKDAKIAFIVDYLAPASQRYRVDNIIEYLQLAGIKSSKINIKELVKYSESVCKAKIIIFFRIPLTKEIKVFLKQSQKKQTTKIYSCDDLIFDPNNFLKKYNLNNNIKNYDRQKTKQFYDLFKKCDYFLSSTEYLANRAEKLGKKAFVIPNALNQKQIDIYQDILKKPERKSNKIILGYFSGTKTHDADFDLISPILIQILKKYPKVNLFLMGHLSIDEKLQKYKKQIIRQKIVHWTKLPYFINKVDINLVPLVNNQLNQGKSELKYFEAGILKIPTITSPIESFKKAIQNGENGFIAESKYDWEKYLKLLIDNKKLRQKIGANAYYDIIKNYSPKVLSNKTIQVLKIQKNN